MSDLPYANLIYGANNIFGLQNPEELRCTVYKMAHGVSDLPMLWIMVNEEESNFKPFNLVFLSIGFFDGPTFWLGANFSVASQDESIAALETLGWLQDTADDIKAALLNTYKLITVTSKQPNYKIRFIATDAYLTDTFPLHFKGV